MRDASREDAQDARARYRAARRAEPRARRLRREHVRDAAYVEVRHMTVSLPRAAT